MDPKLKQDFPIDWDEDQYVSRREFIKFMTLAGGGLAVGSAALAAYTALPRKERRFDRVRIASLDQLEPGKAFEFSYPRKEDFCLLVQPTPGTYKAYSRRCTHLSCPVEWQPTASRFYCPCHNGAFSPKDGAVLMGPPQRPLPEILLEVDGEAIYAVGVRSGEEA